MTNKIDTVLKAITDQITRALPSDMVKNPKLNVNSTSPVSSARSYLTNDPQFLTRIHSSINVITICSKKPKKSRDNKPGENGVANTSTKDEDHHTMVEVEREHKKSEEEELEEKGEPKSINQPSPPDPSISFITGKVHKLNSFLESFSLVPQSSDIKFVCTKDDDGDVMFIEIIKKYDDSYKEELVGDENIITGGLEAEYFDISPIRSELAYHKKPDPRKDPNRGVSNFTGRIKGMHIFVRNFTYVSDFMIVEDISSIIDPRLSQVVLGKPFVEISNMTHDLSLGVVRFTNGINEIAYKMSHKIERYNSLSYLEKLRTKSVYFRNEEDKRRGVDYVMSKILGFYKECLELGPEYLIGLKDEGGVTFTKLINDMRNIKMTMPKMQLNSKSMNNMFPEWGIFVTMVKLNRGLKTSNYEQLYAYLKQHEAHYPLQSSAIPQSAYVPPVIHQPQFADNTQPDSGLTLTDDLIENLTKTVALLTQSYKTHLPQTNNQLRTSSNTRNQATVQNGRVVVQNVQGRQNRGQGIMLGEQLQLEMREFRTEEAMQILFIALDSYTATEQDLALNKENVFQADQYGAFDYDVDEAPTAQTMFMTNLSSADRIYDEAGPSYDLNILSEVQDHDNYPDNVDEYHEYVKDNTEQVVQSGVSSIPNDALMMIINDMHEQAAQCVSANEQNKRITPRGLTEGERGFEQTKECYLTEGIPFFKTLKEHFEGIQTALVKEVKEMKEIFEQIEAEVEQNVMDKQCADIEWKNLLIENENLIADCLSHELLYSVMNDVNTVSRLFEMHDAYTVQQARCLELKAEISKLKHKIEKDDH
ncbi:hypothetical protein Tco_1477263, partial [Tanacetum coccineum]